MSDSDKFDKKPAKPITVSKWVWIIARLAMNQPYPRKEPRVGDLVIETTHIMGLAKRQMGRHDAIGYLKEILKGRGDTSNRYLIKSVDPDVEECWWTNAYLVVVEEGAQ